MPAVKNLNLKELGALLMACHPLVQDGLILGAALDGGSADEILGTLKRLLPGHSRDRLAALARIDGEQVVAAFVGIETRIWGDE